MVTSLHICPTQQAARCAPPGQSLLTPSLRVTTMPTQMLLTPLPILFCPDLIHLQPPQPLLHGISQLVCLCRPLLWPV